MGKQTKHNKNKETQKSYLDASISGTPIPDNGDPILNSSSANTSAPRVTMEPSIAPAHGSSTTSPDDVKPPPTTTQSFDRLDVLSENIEQLNSQIGYLVTSVTSLQSDMSIVRSGNNPRPRSVPSNIGLDRRTYPKDDDDDDDDSDGHPTHQQQGQYPHPTTQFNSNHFSCAVVDNKIKFHEMENYLSKKTLEDDTASSLEQLYEDIV